MFRHQTPKEIRSEYIQMMLTGLFTGLAAAIHPIFFVVSRTGADLKCFSWLYTV